MPIVTRSTSVFASHETPLLMELRTSIEAASLTWALVQADYAVKGRTIPDKITDLHPHERRRYEDRALTCLLSCNRDAELFAQRQGSYKAFELFQAFIDHHGLDWFDSPANHDDGLEILTSQMSDAAITRCDHVLCGIYPGLSRYLTQLERTR